MFLIALTTASYHAAFGTGSVAHYLNGTLRRRGTLLSGYRTLGDTELPDYLAMISGQAPNADTSSDCATYAEFPSSAKAQSNGQFKGPGCVYPNTALDDRRPGHRSREAVEGLPRRHGRHYLCAPELERRR